MYSRSSRDPKAVKSLDRMKGIMMKSRLRSAQHRLQQILDRIDRTSLADVFTHWTQLTWEGPFVADGGGSMTALEQARKSKADAAAAVHRAAHEDAAARVGDKLQAQLEQLEQLQQQVLAAEVEAVQATHAAKSAKASQAAQAEVVKRRGGEHLHPINTTIGAATDFNRVARHGDDPAAAIMALKEDMATLALWAKNVDSQMQQQPPPTPQQASQHQQRMAPSQQRRGVVEERAAAEQERGGAPQLGEQGGEKKESFTTGGGEGVRGSTSTPSTKTKAQTTQAQQATAKNAGDAVGGGERKEGGRGGGQAPLGSAAASNVTHKLNDAAVEEWQGQQYKTFKTVLLRGVTIKKHGRKGKPKRRTLWISDDMQYISWQRGARNPATVKAGATMALREVKVISTGINSEVLRRSWRKAKHQQYLTHSWAPFRSTARADEKEKQATCFS